MENTEGTQTSDTALALERNQKEQAWKHFADQLGNVTDRLGKPIDSGIFDTVVALNLFNIHTTQSCEGHLDGGIAAPWVEMQTPETDELRTLRTRTHKLSDMIDLEPAANPCGFNRAARRVSVGFSR